MAGAKLVTKTKEVVVKKEVSEGVELTLSLVEAQALTLTLGIITGGSNLTDSIFFRLNDLGFKSPEHNIYRENKFTKDALEKITKLVNQKFNLEN